MHLIRHLLNFLLAVEQVAETATHVKGSTDLYSLSNLWNFYSQNNEIIQDVFKFLKSQNKTEGGGEPP